MIHVHDLTHRYGAVDAVQHVSLEVRPGQLVGLVGPNGAGKTTLIRSVATLLRFTAGVVRVGDLDVLREPARVRRVLGYLPERASPYGELTCEEHLDLFAAIAGHQGADRVRRIAAALDAAGLAGRGDTPTADLSKGLRQRLALQAILLHDPPSLVLDEPTDGLDPDSRETLLASIRDLARSGRAVLLTSHVLAELEEHADDVVILSEGRRVAEAERPTETTWRVRLRTDPGAGARLLGAEPWVTRATVDGADLLLTLAPDEPDAARAVEALVRAGLAVTEVERRRETLRDRYHAAVHPPGGAP